MKNSSKKQMKLSLNKVAVSKLSKQQLKSVAGGSFTLFSLLCNPGGSNNSCEICYEN